MARRRVQDEEAALWRMVMRDVVPLHPAPSRPKPQQPAAPARKQDDEKPVSFERAMGVSEPVLRVARRPRVQELRIGVRAPGLDDTSWKRLSRGTVKIDAKLDLHGYIVQDAFDRLLAFMQRARSLNWRCVEVVTGLGSGAASGMIRRELPLWLQRSDIQPMVLAVVHPHAANHGSVRILLRTRRR